MERKEDTREVRLGMGMSDIKYAILVLLIFQATISYAQSPAETQKIAVLKPEVPNDYGRNDLINVISMVEHAGIPYNFVSSDFTYEDLQWYKVLIFPGFTSLNTSQEIAITRAIDAGVSVIWISGDISHLSTLQNALGIKYITHGLAKDLHVSKVRFNFTDIPVFTDEILILGNTEEARPIAQFIDDGGDVSYSAVTYFRKSVTSGHVYFFAFPVHDYWNNSPESAWNWMRPAQLYKALIKSSYGMITLTPYPNNLRALLLVRIEDVSPCNEQVEWLSRARAFKTYTDNIKLPLNIAIIPVYSDPSEGTFITLSESPQLLTFLLDVVRNKGTIIQHGFTHQYGNSSDDYSGIDYEFYDEKSELWLEFKDQLNRIRKGKIAIEENLPIKVTTFETPHYKSNQDTIRAASELGLRFFSEASNRPFIDRFGESGYLEEYGAISIPETLNFIPNIPTTEFYTNILGRAKLLYELNGVQLFFIHLFTDEQLRVVKDLIGEMKKQDQLWTPNIEEAGRFWIERMRTYETMTVREDSGNQLTVTLGRVSVEGLTLRYLGEKEIGFVKVNGKVWSDFGKDHIILGTLTSEHNIITIELDTQSILTYNPFYVAVIVVISLGLVGPLLYVFKNRRRKV